MDSTTYISLNSIWLRLRSVRSEGVMLLVTLVATSNRAVNYAGQPFLSGDGPIFAVLGKQLLDQGTFGFTWARPTFVVLMAAAYRLWGVRATTGTLVSIFFGTLAVPMAYMWGRQIFGKYGGMMAATLLAGSYFHVWWSRWQQSQMAMAFCLTLSVWLYSRETRRDGSYGFLFLSGLTLGLAFTLHYSVLILPFLYLAFEVYWFLRLRLAWHVFLARLGALAGGALTVIAVAWVLMPSYGGYWWPRFSHHLGLYRLAKGCCYGDELKSLYEEGPGTGAVGDWGAYVKAILIFEGWGGVVLLFLAGLWIGSGQWRGKPGSMWIAGLSLGTFIAISLAAAMGGGRQAKTLAIVFPTMILIVGHVVTTGLLWLARRARLSQKGVMLTATILLLGVGSWHVSPLARIQTPYEAMKEWLSAHGTQRVVILFPFGRAKPFVWSFYFGPEAVTWADDLADLATQCQARAPDFMIKDSVSSLAGPAAGLPLRVAFADPTATDNAPYGSEPLQRLLIYDMRGCADVFR